MSYVIYSGFNLMDDVSLECHKLLTSITLEQNSLDDVKHDLIGTLKNLVHAQVSKDSLYWVVLQVAIAAMHLQRIIDDVKTLVSCKLFGHGTVHRIVGILFSDAHGSMSHHKSTSLQIRRHFRKLELNVLVVAQLFAELLSLFYVIFSDFECSRCTT